MTAEAIIGELRGLGITLQVHGDRLRFHPRSAVSGELLDRLRGCKGELLARLQNPGNGNATSRSPGTDRVVSPAPGTPVPTLPAVYIGDDPQNLQRQDSDAADWKEFTTPDGCREWQRGDAADLQDIDVAPCLTCGGLERWQDIRGDWHCERCHPRRHGPRLHRLARRIRERHEGRPRA
jgi:TubC N-terminal docking domain